MRIVFAGTPMPALPSLQRFIDSPRHDVIAVLTRPDAAAGRRGRPAPSPVAQMALDAGIPVLRPDRPNSVEFVAEMFFFEQLQHEEGAQVFFGVVSGNFAFARVTTELEKLRVIERAWIIEHLAREGAMLLTACG